MNSKSKAQNRVVVALLDWFAANARDLPWRRTKDSYAIWVSEIMLQQTQVRTVLPYWERWMRALPTITSLAKAPPARIHKLWEGLGYYTRVRNMQRAAQLIMREHGGKFPRYFDDILALPGIGRYTAGAICSIAFNQPKPILDGNVIRVLARLFGIHGNPRQKRINQKLWQLAEELVVTAATQTRSPKIITHLSHRSNAKADHALPDRKVRSTLHAPRPSPLAPLTSHFNQSLMELGALICTPKNPQCTACPVVNNCVAHRTGSVDRLPVPGRKIPITNRTFVAFVTQKRGKYLISQRPPGVVNSHLWEFPNVELTNGTDIRLAARRLLGAHFKELSRICVIKHSITRYRITLQAFHVRDTPPRIQGLLNARWYPGTKLRQLPFTSAHRKILDRLS